MTQGHNVSAGHSGYSDMTNISYAYTMGGVQILGRSHEVKSASFAQPAADMAEDLLLLARACDHPRPRGASTAPLSVVISG